MIITVAPEDKSATIPDLLASVDTPIFFPAKNGFVPAADVPAATDTFPSGRNAGADVEYKLPVAIPSVNPKVFPVPQTGIVKPKAVFPFGILNERFHISILCNNWRLVETIYLQTDCLDNRRRPLRKASLIVFDLIS